MSIQRLKYKTDDSVNRTRTIDVFRSVFRRSDKILLGTEFALAVHSAETKQASWNSSISSAAKAIIAATYKTTGIVQN